MKARIPYPPPKTILGPPRVLNPQTCPHLASGDSAAVRALPPQHGALRDSAPIRHDSLYALSVSPVWGSVVFPGRSKKN